MNKQTKLNRGKRNKQKSQAIKKQTNNQGWEGDNKQTKLYMKKTNNHTKKEENKIANKPPKPDRKK